MNIRRAEERAEKVLKSTSTRKTIRQVSSVFPHRFHVLPRRAIEFLGLFPGAASLIANTFSVAPSLIARRDQKIASLVANVVIRGPNTARSLVLDSQGVILTVDD